MTMTPLIATDMLAADIGELAWIIAVLVFAGISALAEKFKDKNNEGQAEKNRDLARKIREAIERNQKRDEPSSSDERERPRPTPRPERPATRPRPAPPTRQQPQPRPTIRREPKAPPARQRPASATMAQPRARREAPKPVARPQPIAPRQVTHEAPPAEEVVFRRVAEAEKAQDPMMANLLTTRRQRQRSSNRFGGLKLNDLQRAVILSEIFRPPVALRDEEPGRGKTL